MLQYPNLSNDQRRSVSRVPDSEFKQAETEVKEYINGAKLAIQQFKLEGYIHKANAAAIDAQTAQTGLEVAQVKADIAQVKLEGVRGDLAFAREVLQIRTQQQRETLEQMRGKAENLLEESSWL